MGVHLSGQLHHALAAGHGVGDLLDQVGRMQAVDVGTEHLAAALVEQQLHQAVALQLGQGLGIGLEIAAHRSQLKTLLGRQGLGIDLAQAHRADLRVGEGGRRN